MVSPVSGPKYLSVREHLRRRVTALPEQTLLPPEPVLCAEYGVSRITLRRAVDGLVADGHLVREQGRGTYVTRPAIRHEYRESFVHRIAGFSSVMSDHGAQVGTKVLTQRVVPAPAAVAAELALDGAADVVELERLRSVDGEPNHVAHSFLPAAPVPARGGGGLQPGLALRVPPPRVRRRPRPRADRRRRRHGGPRGGRPAARRRRVPAARRPHDRPGQRRASRWCTASPGCAPT